MTTGLDPCKKYVEMWDPSKPLVPCRAVLSCTTCLKEFNGMGAWDALKACCDKSATSAAASSSTRTRKLPNAQQCPNKKKRK